MDKLRRQLVLDTNHDSVSSGAQAPGVAIERVRSPASFKGRTLESQWGLSLHLTSTKGTETKRFMLDYGFTPDVLNSNLELLEVDLPAIDAMILSHGHLDHMGGMMGCLAKQRSVMKAD